MPLDSRHVLGQHDGSVGKDAYGQVWGPEFNPGRHMIEWGDQYPQVDP